MQSTMENHVIQPCKPFFLFPISHSSPPKASPCSPSIRLPACRKSVRERSMTGFVTKTGLTDTTVTNVLTVTVPNGQVAGVLRVTSIGSMGAGGAIGAGESVHAISYDFVFCRTAGVAAVALISTAYGSAKNNVAGSVALTTASTVSAVTGGVTASNTFQITVAITKASGTSDNHVAFVKWEVLNTGASGITVAAT